jgi:hypothetical protein
MPLSFGRTLTNRGAPFPIYQAKFGAPFQQGCALLTYQAKLGAPFQQGRALSYQSGKVGHALLTRACPFLSIKQCGAKNLEWMEE